jgi:hypothetical protein
MQIRDGDQLLDVMRDYQVSCVLAAAVELDAFKVLAESPASADQTARRLGCDLRGMTILLDALVAVGLLSKQGPRYTVPAELAPFLDDSSPRSVMAMLQHQANCLRRWARLPWIVRWGRSSEWEASIRGKEADQAAFIEAMNVVCRDVADGLVREINPGACRCVLDVGGGPGTWTMAWLKAEPTARAILFDLPHVIPMARKKITEAGFGERTEFVAGDFHTDRLPAGADAAWVSAIIHQNSRQQNRALYRRVAEAIVPGGWILIRDVVMDDGRTEPVAGALFAVNMLVGTEAGNSYTLTEIREDLEGSGFAEVELVRHDEGMHSVVRARRPAE